jgi:integrase
LSAIRFFHDKISEPRFRLPDNSDLELSRRKFLGFDRTWSDSEFVQMCGLAEGLGRRDFAVAMTLAYHAGLRIHECCRLDTAAAENAMRSGFIAVKGKNGKPRTVPINAAISGAFRERLAAVGRGQKLLVPSGTPTHIYIKKLQKFIANHRGKLPPRDGREPLTFHGLRHSFAVRKFADLVAEGSSESRAKREVSRLLGHEREDVTEVYLGSLRGGGR